VNWHRRYRILHFLEIVGDLFYRGLRRGMISDCWTIIQIAWRLTERNKESLEEQTTIKEEKEYENDKAEAS